MILHASKPIGLSTKTLESFMHILRMHITNFMLIFMMHLVSWPYLQLHSGDIAALGWWDLFINFGYDLFVFKQCLMIVYSVSASWNNSCSSIYSIAECFAFLVCTKWYNPTIHRHSNIRESSSSSMCNLQDIGGHVMKVPFVTFQILLFMRLEV